MGHLTHKTKTRKGTGQVRNDKERLLDVYLAAAARIGDRQALGRLMERWQPKLLGHPYRLTGEADLAADMAQEAWIEVMRGIARLDDTAAFPAWAMRIVGHVHREDRISARAGHRIAESAARCITVPDHGSVLERKNGLTT